MFNVLFNRCLLNKLYKYFITINSNTKQIEVFIENNKNFVWSEIKDLSTRS